MAMEDTESCSSRSVESSSSAASQPKNHHRKLEVYNEVLRRLRASHASPFPSSSEDGLWSHFNRLPSRYALDVNVERAEDVLMHKRLLQMAADHANRPVFEVRVVQVPVLRNGIPLNSDAEGEQESSSYVQIGSVHPPPAFGSSPNLEALALEARGSEAQDGDSVANAKLFTPRRMHEITFSSDDKPKLLSQLTSLLGDIGLNIQEAHAFCTNDGYSLDVFVVEGWPHEETDKLKLALQNEIQKMEKQPSLKADMPPPVLEFGQTGEKKQLDHLLIPSDGADVWEINIRKIKFEKKVASGAYGDLYKGTYCSQDVAIKMLKPERMNADMQKEFSQEVYIMRKVRHKNVVQFIGACTKLPSLCIVTEFMSGGSVYDYLHKHKGVFKISALLRVAIDVSKGMNYLHQNSIIHRDLKAANLLLDENEVVKVADFGVARVKCQSGVMTAETGTYRWMAPEVIEHKPYDHKADVYSFGIVLWELLTGKIPHEYLTPLQAAVGVVQKGLRPTIPKSTHPKLAELLGRCWQQDPNLRPDFSEILETLQGISTEVGNESENRRRERSSSSGFRSVLRHSHR